MVKQNEKFDQEKRVLSTCFAHFWSVHEGDIGCLLALAGWYIPPTGFCHKLYEITVELQSRASHLLRVWHICHSFTQAHRRVSKAQWKTCSLRQQRNRAPNILTLSWRILDEPLRWKVVVESCKDAGILGPQRRSVQYEARDEAWSLRAFV